MRTISQLCRPSILAAALVTSVLGACADSPTGPLSSPRSFIALPDDGGTLPPPPDTTSTATPAPAPTPAPTPGALIPVFVIGDAQPHGVGDAVNFWGSQWWKHNRVSGATSGGTASFKGYATQADLQCGGVWTTRSNGAASAPAVIAGTIAVIVTSKLDKQGSDFSGDIQQIVTVAQDGGYAPAAGHAGNGIVTGVTCTRQ